MPENLMHEEGQIKAGRMYARVGMGLFLLAGNNATRSINPHLLEAGAVLDGANAGSKLVDQRYELV